MPVQPSPEVRLQKLVLISELIEVLTPGEKAFRKWLHKSESKPHEQTVKPAIRVLGKLIAPGHFAPAGPLHIAVMFGPLLIETGVPKYVAILYNQISTAVNCLAPLVAY